MRAIHRKSVAVVSVVMLVVLAGCASTPQPTTVVDGTSMIDKVAVEDQVLVVSLNESATYGDSRLSHVQWETPSGSTKYYTELDPGQTNLWIGNTASFNEGVHTLTLIQDESPVLRLQLRLSTKVSGMATTKVETIEIVEEDRSQLDMEQENE